MKRGRHGKLKSCSPPWRNFPRYEARTLAPTAWCPPREETQGAPLPVCAMEVNGENQCFKCGKVRNTLKGRALSGKGKEKPYSWILIKNSDHQLHFTPGLYQKPLLSGKGGSKGGGNCILLWNWVEPLCTIPRAMFSPEQLLISSVKEDGFSYPLFEKTPKKTVVQLSFWSRSWTNLLGGDLAA